MPSDETIVPAFEAPPLPPTGSRKRSGFVAAALASVALHVALVTVAAWAIGGGLVSPQLPTLGSRGDMAEGGLSDDPGISALTTTRLPEAEQTAVEAVAALPP